MRKLKLFSLLCLLLVGVGQVWGNQVSFAWSGTQNATTKAITWTSDVCTMVQEQNGAQTAPNSSYISAPRWYSGNKITITAGSGVSTFTSIVITATSNAYATALANSTYARTGGTGSVSASASGTAVTITCTGTVTAFTIVMGGQSRLSGTTTPTINYTPSGTPQPTLSSVAVSGTPSKTTYEAGDAFDASGLTVTGTYSDSSNKTETSGITWSACKTENGTYVALDNAAVKLAKDETGIYVKATVGGKTSQAFHVIGLTVTAALPKSTLVFEDEYKDSGATADDDAEWEVTSDATESTYDAARGIHFGTNNTSQVQYVQLTTSDIAGTIKQVVVNAADAAGTATISVSVGGTAFTCSGSTTVANTNPGSNYTFTGSKSGEIIVRIDRGSAAYKGIYIKSIVVTYEEAAVTQVATPVITGTDNFYPSTTVSISCGTDGAAILYSIDGSAPSLSYTAPFTVDADGTTVVKAKATKAGLDPSEVASASFTKATPLTTMQAIFDAAGTTGNQIITFSNTWVVTGVSTNGKNAYLTDGTKGLILYNTSASSGSPVAGLAKDKTLSGTVTRNLTLYNSAAELTDFTADGLTVGNGTTPDVRELDAEGIAALSAVNTGSLIKISGQCIYENSKYYIKYGNGDNDKVQVYNTLYAFESMTANANYEVTGVYIQFNAIKEIAPRDGDDIVLEVVKSQPNTYWNGAASGNLTVRANESVANQWSTASTGTKHFGTSDDAIATIADNGDITLVGGLGNVVLTYTTDANDNYYAGEATLTLNVKAALPAGASEFTWVAADMGVDNGTAVTTATDNEDPISIVFAQGEGSNAPKYYTSGYAVRSYVQNTITISSAVEGKLIYGVEIVFANSTNNKLSGDDLSVDGTSGTWSGLAQEVVFNVPNVSGNQAHLVSINVIYANGTVTELEIANVAMKTTDNPLTIVPTKHNPNSAPILYTIATEDQQYATIEDGVITPHKVTVTPINVTASIAAGSNYTAASTTFTITVSEKQVPALSFPAASYNANLGSTFTAPTLTNPVNVTVAYSSSEEGVATVNASTGAIELVGEGTTTITAAFAGNGDYAANSASYTLNVADPYKDVLTATGLELAGYADFSNKTFASGVKYAGNAMKSTTSGHVGAIQMRVQNPSGIVTTEKVGYLKSISASTSTANAEGHILQIYAKATAYESGADLYDADKRGTLIGTISNEGGVMVFEEGKAYSDHYKYIGIKANGGAVYYDDIIVKWEPAVFTTYSVTYEAGEGADGEDLVISNIEEGETIQLAEKPNDFAKTDNVFAGWKLDNAGETLLAGDDYTVNANAVFVAQWSESYTVTYKPGEGSGDNVVVGNLPSGSYHLAANTFTAPEGKVFIGWKLENVTEDARPAGSEYTITSSVAFVAQWITANVVTFVAGTDMSDGNSITKDGITITASKFDGDTYYQCFGTANMTIAAGLGVGTILKIELTCTAEGSAKYGPGQWELEGYSYAGAVGTWNGSSASVEFGAAAQQARMTQVVVYYAPDTRVASELAWDPAEDIELTVGTAFTPRTLLNPNGIVASEISIESSNTSLATVTNGEVALVADATGEATITATFAGNASYKPATVSYKITVNPAYSIYVQPSLNVNFGSVNQNAEVADKSITVTLTGVDAATLTLEGTGASAFTISPDAALTASGDITISASSANIGTFAATLTISDDANNAESKVVNISITVNEVVTPETAVSTHTKWVAATEIVNGMQVLIVGERNEKIYAVGAQTSNNRTAVEGSLSEGVFTPGENTMAFTVVAQEGGTYALQASNGKYLYAAGSGSGKNYLRSQDEVDDNAKWTLSVSSATANGTNTNNKLQLNNSSDIFSCYSSTQKAIQFYVPKQEEIRGSLTEGKMGTICPKQEIKNPTGASFYTLTFKEVQNEKPYKVFFDEIAEGASLEAGKPYLFIAEGDAIMGVKVGDPVAAAQNYNGFIGVLTDEFKLHVEEADRFYIVYENQIRLCGAGWFSVPVERAYLDMSQMPEEPVAQAPGRRRVCLTNPAANAPTDIDAINASEKPMKLMIDGQLFIIRGEKMFDATGRLVK